MSSVDIQQIARKYFNFYKGIFIEAGAADGVIQSNTLFLENEKHWTGILIEPNVESYRNCVNVRPSSKVYNCALVSYEYADTEIEMFFRSWHKGDPGLVTSTFDSPINSIDAWEGHNYSYKIPARTLDSILEESKIESVDFFSLDVEGYELQVLKGFNVKKYKPKIILLETHHKTNMIAEITNLLVDYYIVENPTPHDYVFKYKDL